MSIQHGTSRPCQVQAALPPPPLPPDVLPGVPGTVVVWWSLVQMVRSAQGVMTGPSALADGTTANVNPAPTITQIAVRHEEFNMSWSPHG
ncbi:hypothetical protein Kpho02_04360 [Kitasatospora phosalacinea]|uniref:Uncharacterized protein n=1 Tax=Kitasatospora phosalacinea TaxID=2065 RepID=A0A9W6Q1V6_9ACTN|nr:hypothetical protein Kpho02_04360 [Kitasatospora phosalacinea]